MIRWILLTILMVVALQAQAFDYTGKFGIGGSIGPDFAGKPFNDAADENANWGAHLRYHFTNKYSFELGYNLHDFDESAINAKVYDLALLYQCGTYARFSPVIGLGLGAVELQNYNPSSFKLGARAILGFEYSLSEYLSAGIRAEYQRIGKMSSSNNSSLRTVNVLTPKFIITWYFGGANDALQEVAAPVKEVVKDVPVVEPEVVTKVEEVKKEPTDSDHDGVMDDEDKCPNTEANVVVNNYGCKKEEKAVVTLNVQFAAGKSIVDSQYDSQVEELAKFMIANPNTKVSIEGHTDNKGKENFNVKLSETRAKAVMEQLVSKYKIEGLRLTSKGFGSATPIADNNTEDGRQKNRRVIAIISE